MKKQIFVLLLLLTGVLAMALGGKASAAPATFTVTNTDDSGAGSLRQAITDANSNGNSSDMDVIEFNIPGSDVHTISIATDLPAVTQKLTIDGYSQPGAQENTAASPEPINSVIKIEIAATNATITQGAIGLVADGSIVKGLSIYDASAPNPSLAYSNLALVGTGTSVKGSYIGLRADGFTPGQDYKNSASVLAAGNNIVIGGTNPGDRNVFYSKSTVGQSAGIITVGQGATIYGNYVGLAKDGITDLTPYIADSNGLSPPFSMGINLINGGGNTVGGPNAGEKNVVAGNSAGIIISSPNNVVQGNYIGTTYQGAVSSGITNGMGMTAVAGSDSLVGGTGAGEGNVIAGVKGSGIEIAEMSIPAASTTITPNKIAVIGNSMYDIQPFNLLGIGNSNLGIDLSSFTDNDANYVPDEFTNRGPTANDIGDNDTGPNGFINTPVLKTAQQVGNKITITYDLDAADSPSSTYRLEFFANDESTVFGYGPGETYLGAVTVSPGTNKTAELTVSGDHSNKALSATTTAIDGTTNSGFGSTSEFSKNISIGSATDFDSDGAPDAIENSAPNNGDGNNDGIQDSLQPTVTSFLDYDDSHYITFITNGCSENGTVSSIDASTVGVKDNGYTYQHGLTDFTLNCSRGDTVNVTLYIHDSNADINKFIPRKYNPSTKVFTDLEGATLVRETVGTSNAIKLAYSVTDGGKYDDDGNANGVVVDPVGLASESSGVLANTGIFAALAMPVGFILVAGGLYTYVDYRKHKKPLLQDNPELASTYTYWHHLKVVAIPMAKYRMTVLVEKKEQEPVGPTLWQ